MNTNGETMGWLFSSYSMNKGHPVLGVVTGKPLDIYGLAVERVANATTIRSICA